MPLKVAVVGGRKYADYARVKRDLDRCWETWGAFDLVTGGARGADKLAMRWAWEKGIKPEVIRPEYDGVNNQRAPLLRNGVIAETCDVMIAYWDGRSRGTKDAVEKARRLGKPVYLRMYGGGDGDLDREPLAPDRTGGAGPDGVQRAG